jgi:predicted 3-demethylubiquinone-9 3-methyltransferase (glyoxalase superfamily)
MQKITTFLTFNNQAEEAVRFYTSIFKNSKILSTMPAQDGTPGPKGTLMSLSFQLEGQEFIALNGGPSFTFAQGISLFVSCETQAEVDELWEKLSEGGQPNRCGWLKDKFGVSWQVIPTVLGKMLSEKDPQKQQRVFNAMLRMNKLDVSALKKAYEQG